MDWKIKNCSVTRYLTSPYTWEQTKNKAKMQSNKTYSKVKLVKRIKVKYQTILFRNTN